MSWSRRSATSTSVRADAVAQRIPAQAPTPTGRRCSRSSNSTRCSSARRRCITRRPAVAALAAGLPVYLEKPLARSLADGRAIVSAWQKSGTVCAVGYQWRSLDVLAELQALLRVTAPGMLVSRSYGPTEHARRDLEGRAEWFADPRRSGGILFELASHDIDLQIAHRRLGRVGAGDRGERPARPGGPARNGPGRLRLGSPALLRRRHRRSPRRLEPGPVPAALRPRRPRSRRGAPPRPRPALRTDRPRPRKRSSDQGQDPAPRLLGHPLPGSRPQPSDPAAVPCTPADALRTLAAVIACEQAITTGERVAL